jgi:hypothetical protein
MKRELVKRQLQNAIEGGKTTYTVFSTDELNTISFNGIHIDLREIELVVFTPYSFVNIHYDWIDVIELVGTDITICTGIGSDYHITLNKGGR